jgi:hypothetical protein
MNTQEIAEILNQIAYKPGWSIAFTGGKDGGQSYLQVAVSPEAEASMDTIDRVRRPWRGAKIYLSPHMCRQEIVGAAFGAIQAAELHEMREWFRYRGTSIYNPHLDPDFLAAAIKGARRRGERVLSVRDGAMTMVESPAATPRVLRSVGRGGRRSGAPNSARPAD